jgi:hypothetical protein
MKEQLQQYKELKQQIFQMQKGARLEVGCEVTLANGEKQVISEIKYGDEAIGKNCFFRWSAFFPYEIEHAAMENFHEIVDVKWN